MKTITAFLLSGFLCISAYSQLNYEIIANHQMVDSITICQGQSLTLNSVSTIFYDDFNTGSLSNIWSANFSPMFSNPCAAPVDGTTYLWVGPSMSQPRSLTTIDLDVNSGYQICFDMIYAIQSQPSPCEGPDLPSEGVFLQYSTDDTTWIDINYWPPDDPNCPGNAGYDDCMTSWRTYCEYIPSAAADTSVKFRWHQLQTSSNNYDHWGIDNVYIGDTTYSINWFENGTLISSSNTPSLIYPAASGTYVAQFISDTDTIYDTLHVIIDNNCISLNGYAYYDDDLNCIKNPGESGINQVQVLLYDNGQYIGSDFTNNNGFYEFTSLPNNGNYSISISHPVSLCYSIFCPANGTINVSGAYNNLNFAHELSTGFDLTVTGTATGFVPGTAGSIFPYISSLCNEHSGQLILFLDDTLLNILSYSIPVSQTIGDSVVWNFNVPDDLDGLYIVYETDTLASIGDIICFDLYVNPLSGDMDTSNNHFLYCDDVVASYDPNNKTVQPRGTGVQRFIQPDISLTYTINFQNTGTASAQNILIADTIDYNLDISTLVILANSHDVDVSANGNKLEFYFQDIMLPDSTSDYYGSMGHVIYRIDQKPNLIPLTEIRNQAHIYFDYNLPIHTNQTLNTIDEPVSIFIKQDQAVTRIYPNPANNLLNVEASKNFDLEIMNINGQSVITRKNCNKISGFDISELKPGVFLIKIKSGDSIEIARFVKL